MPPPEEATSGAGALLKVRRLARRQIGLILALGLAGGSLGVVYVKTTPPSFAAEATLLVETRKLQLFQKAAVVDAAALDGAEMDSQVQLLRSDAILRAVVDRLDLTHVLEFSEPPASVLARLAPFLPWRSGSEAGAREAEGVRTADELVRSAMDSLQGRLEVSRVGASYLITIRCRSSDAALAAAIANGVVDVYIADQRNARSTESAGAATWLNARISELLDQSVAADQAVNAFKTQNKIVMVKGQLLDDQGLGELNSQLAAARQHTSDVRARLDRIQAVVTANTADPSDAATVTDALNSPTITKLRSQTIELSARIADWSSRFGADHLAVVDVRRQLLNTRLAILQELRQLAETYKSEYAIAKQSQDGIEQQIAASVLKLQADNRAQSKLHELESAAQTYRSLHDDLVQRYTETAQQQSFPIGNARLITQAVTPMTKSQPKSRLIVSFAAFAGLLAGAGWGALREMMDRVFRTRAQVETLLQAECIGMIPAVSPTRQRRRAKRAPGGSERLVVRRSSVIWTPIDNRRSVFTEALRSIKSAMDLSACSPQRMLGITSTLPNEGKSVTAAALALHIAEVGARVLLVDCDIRNPSLTRELSPGAEHGLLDVVMERVTLEQATWREAKTNLTFLPGCVASPPSHSNEILAMPAMKRLFDRLRADYDYVIVDLAPIAPLVDVRSTAGMVDAYALVVEWGQTEVDMVMDALKSTRIVQENLLGVILSKVNTSRMALYEGPRAKHYYYAVE